jgi:hypothetical protein
MSISSGFGFIGKITLSNTLSCDRVMEGAFFPHPDFQVPEEEMCQHAGDDVVVPPWKLTNLVVVHSQFCLGFLETLFDCPSQPTEPHKRVQPCAGHGVADEIAVLGVFTQRSTDQ